MEGNSFTHVTYKRNPTYFEKLGNSCCGIVTGLLIILLAFPLLFLNEVKFRLYYFNKFAF